MWRRLSAAIISDDSPAPAQADFDGQDERDLMKWCRWVCPAATGREEVLYIRVASHKKCYTKKVAQK